MKNVILQFLSASLALLPLITTTITTTTTPPPRMEPALDFVLDDLVENEILNALSGDDYAHTKAVLKKNGLGINSTIIVNNHAMWAPLYHAVLTHNSKFLACILDDPEFLPDSKTTADVFALCCNSPGPIDQKWVSVIEDFNLRVFRELINHPKVDIEHALDSYDRSVLYHIVYHNKLDFLKELIFSGKLCSQNRTCIFTTEMDNYRVTRHFLTPEVIAKRLGHNEAANLLAELRKFPLSTIQKVRLDVGDFTAYSAHLFCCIVLLCDGYLAIKGKGKSKGRGDGKGEGKCRPIKVAARQPTAPKPAPESANRIERFLSIGARLPMELQMMLCNRAGGSGADIILTTDSEMSFVSLFRLIS